MSKVFCKGFTLVELALSMAFVGILSVAVVLIISETIASYRRGLTLAQINSTGMDLVDDMRLAVSNSSAQAVSVDCAKYYEGDSSSSYSVKNKCENDDAYSFVTVTKTSKITLYKGTSREESPFEAPIYGAFCTGTYSYIWNSGYFEMEEASFAEKNSKEWAKLKYSAARNSRTITVNVVGSLGKNDNFNKTAVSNSITVGWEGENARPFRLLKIHDTNRAVCISAARPVEDEYNDQDTMNERHGNVFDITGFGVLDESPVDLMMADSENDLALFDLFVARPAESSTQKNMFYAVSFILGTTSGGANITETSGRLCKAPTDYDVENYDYCAINKFNFAMQATGELR